MMSESDRFWKLLEIRLRLILSIGTLCFAQSYRRWNAYENQRFHSQWTEIGQSAMIQKVCEKVIIQNYVDLWKMYEAGLYF